MTTMPKSTISYLVALQAALLLTWLHSYDAFINVETAFFSAFLIVMGSLYSYRSLVRRRVESAEVPNTADAIEKIEDPYGLYEDDTEEGNEDDRPLKEVIKEEKARLKAGRSGARNVKMTAPALLSAYRLVPYAVLILSFMALNNNRMLMLSFYLPGLAAGIVAGYMSGKALFLRR